LLNSGTVVVSQTAGISFSTGVVTFNVTGHFLIQYGFAPTSNNRSTALSLNGVTISGSIIHNAGNTRTTFSNSIIISATSGDTLRYFNFAGANFNLGTAAPAGQLTTVAYLTVTQLD